MADARWLLIVDREHPDLHDVLSRALRGEPRATVLWERRQRGLPTSGERGPERRRAPLQAAVGACYVAATAAANGTRSEAALVANGLGSLACPSCGVLYAYDPPTFPMPPARVDVSIRHGASSQHTVELQAFTATGRLLMSHQSRATRRQGP